jgi:hypothetical protein
MTDIWTPSDGWLLDDPIAAAKVEHPFDPPNLADAGIVLPDDLDDEACEVAAAVALAELDDDDTEGDEPGIPDDDEED